MMEDQDFKRKVRFIMKFAKALHIVGSPAHTLETVFLEMCHLLKIRGTVLSLPTSIVASFKQGDDEVTRIERVEPMGVNLGKLSLVDSVAQELLRGQLSYEEASERLDDIFLKKDPYGKRITLAYFTFYSVGFTVLLGGTWADIVGSLIVGCLIGLVSLFRLGGGISQLLEAIMAILASFATYLLGKLIPEINVGVVILSSLVIFLPGLFITLAMAEIATQNLASGTSRLVGGGMILLKLTFGVFIGSKFASWFHYPPLEISFAPIPWWITFVFVPFVAFMSMVSFKAERRDWKAVTVAGIFGYSCAKIGTFYLGPELGTFFGGCCVGAMSNVFARVWNRPSSIFQFPGIILLVPGSVGYRSLNFLFERNVLGGLDTAFTMITLAMALVVGLFLGNVLVKPRQSI